MLHQAVHDAVAAWVVPALARGVSAERACNCARLLLTLTSLTALLLSVVRRDLAELIGAEHAPCPVGLRDEALGDGIHSRDEWVQFTLQFLGGEPPIFTDISLARGRCKQSGGMAVGELSRSERCTGFELAP